MSTINHPNIAAPKGSSYQTTTHTESEFTAEDQRRQREAQELLHFIQRVMAEKEAPGIDILGESLRRVEVFSNEVASQPHIDLHTRKTLEDISTLLMEAQKMGKHKGLEDRLKRIYVESQRALEAHRGENVPAKTKEATQRTLELLQTWRPLFYLLIRSREFRQLILDTVKITRKVVYSRSKPWRKDLKEKFLKGEDVKHVKENVKEKAREKKGVPELSDEEWDTIQEDLQRVVRILSKEESYRHGIEKLFSLLDLFKENIEWQAASPALPTPTVHATTINPDKHTEPKDLHIHIELPDNIGKQTAGKGKVRLPEDVRNVVHETEELVASFSGRETLDHFKYHLRNIILKTKRDEHLRDYLSELKHFILKTRSEEEVQSEEWKMKSKSLARRGRHFLKEDEDLKDFLNAVNDMMENIKNDELLQLLRHHAGIIKSDLSYVDSEGKTQLDFDLLTRLQTALIPVVIDALKYIPVPRIQSADEDREFWLDNIILCSHDILPKNIRFHLETNSELSLEDIEFKGTQAYLVIELDHLRTELKDVEFWFKIKNQPLVGTVEDQGRVTFRIKGDGAKLTLTYRVEQSPNEEFARISEGYASFNISAMDIEFDKSALKHPVLVPMMTAMFKRKIKTQIEQKVEHNLAGFINKLGESMSRSLSQVNRPLLAGLSRTKKAVQNAKTTQTSH